MEFAHLTFVEGTAMKMLLICSTVYVGLIVLLATSLMAGEPPKQDAVKKDLDGIQGPATNG